MFRKVRTQFLAALGDPSASSGTGAELWGIWRVDPGPRGVRLRDFQALSCQPERKAPAGWKFNPADFWIEEHGLIMEAPDVPIVPASAAGPHKFIVTGDREVTTVLSVHGDGRWELEKGTLYDVTHLPCRSARYVRDGGPSKAAGAGAGTGADGGVYPSAAEMRKFPVPPGALMPGLDEHSHRDYAVIFVTAVHEPN